MHEFVDCLRGPVVAKIVELEEGRIGHNTDPQFTHE